MGTAAQAGYHKSGKKVLKKIVRKKQIIRRKIWKLNENQTRVRFEKVKKLVITGLPDWWNTIPDAVSKACDKVCKKRNLGKTEKLCGGRISR